MMAFTNGCKDKWTPDFITRLGWETKIKSMQEDDAGNIGLVH